MLLLNTNYKNTESLRFNISTNIHSLDAYTGFFGIDRYEQLNYLLCRQLPYSCHKKITIVHCIYFEYTPKPVNDGKKYAIE